MNGEKNPEVSEAPRRGFGKFVLKFFLLIVGVFILASILIWAVRWVELRQGQTRVQNIAEGFKKAEEEARARAMADTYGGKTPQETLQMYIEAVEKGDYELASKYFIEEKREEEIKSFDGATREFIKEYVDLISRTNGDYDADRKYYSAYKPIGVRMVLYPNGIWKIIEI